MNKIATACLLGVILMHCAPELVADDEPASSAGEPATPSAMSSHRKTAEELQNPFGNLIVLPFQNIMATGFDPGSGWQNTLNIQPAVPLRLNDRWKLMLRPILPVVRQTWPDGAHGIGDFQFEPFFSPVRRGGIQWGVGPVLSFPTASDDELGFGKYTAGPAFALFGMSESWTYSVIATQQWSYAGDSDRDDVSLFNLQPTVSYNLQDGWFLLSGPLISADWTAESGQQWLVPFGGGVGKVMSLGKSKLSLSIEYYRNIVRPDAGPENLAILTATFIFRER